MLSAADLRRSASRLSRKMQHSFGCDPKMDGRRAEAEEKKKLSRELFHGGGQTVQFPGRTRRSRACVLPLNRLFQRVFPSSVCTVNENNTQAISVYRSRRRQTRRQPRPNTGSTAAPCALPRGLREETDCGSKPHGGRKEKQHTPSIMSLSFVC